MDLRAAGLHDHSKYRTVSGVIALNKHLFTTYYKSKEVQQTAVHFYRCEADLPATDAALTAKRFALTNEHKIMRHCVKALFFQTRSSFLSKDKLKLAQHLNANHISLKQRHQKLS